MDTTVTDTVTDSDTQVDAVFPKKRRLSSQRKRTLVMGITYALFVIVVAFLKFGQGKYVHDRASDVECNEEWYRRLWLYYYTISLKTGEVSKTVSEKVARFIKNLLEIKPSTDTSTSAKATPVVALFDFISRYDAGRRLLGMVLILASLIYANRQLQNINSIWHQILIMFGLGSANTLDVDESQSVQRPLLFDLVLSGFRVVALSMAILMLCCLCIYGFLAFYFNVFTDKVPTMEHFTRIVKFIFSYAGTPLIGDAYGVFDVGILLIGSAVIGTLMGLIYFTVVGSVADGADHESKLNIRADNARAVETFTTMAAATLLVLRCIFFFSE